MLMSIPCSENAHNKRRYLNHQIDTNNILSDLQFLCTAHLLVACINITTGMEQRRQNDVKKGGRMGYLSVIDMTSVIKSTIVELTGHEILAI